MAASREGSDHDMTKPEERPADTEEQMVAYVQGMDGKRLRYKDLVR